MTNKNLEKLFDLKSELSNIKTDFKDNDLSKSRLGSLVITKLEEVKHWLSDLIDEAIEEEEKNEMTPGSCGVTAGHLNSGSSD